VRNIIRETNEVVTTLDMRGGEATGEAGYDGIVETSKATPFVPDGRSVWELGTSGDPAGKATDDYTKRTEKPLGEDPANTTFVFVSARHWPTKQKWIDERKKGPWKDLRVFDAYDIEAALDAAKGTHYIFSDQIGKPAAGVRSLEEWWERFAASTNPYLSAEMALAGREDEATQLVEVLRQDIARTTVGAAHTDDGLAFVAAAIASADDDLRAELFSRALIVHEAAALRVLDLTAKFLILLPFDENLHREAQLLANHHIVLIAGPGMPATVTVKPVDPERFSNLLMAQGVLGDRAQQLARAASRSLVAFQHEAAPTGAVMRRQWADWFRSQILRRAWLAGGWIEVRAGDDQIMASLLGQTLAEGADQLREAARGEDPVFTAIANVWAVASPEASWPYIKPNLSQADLTALEQAIQQVLGAIDPKLELPVDQRWQAAIHGKSRIHSQNLRFGLTTTLAVLGSLGEDHQLGGGVTLQIWAQMVVRRLFERANADTTGDLWTSFSDLLPLLAEAAPQQFLDAVHEGVTGPDPVLRKLFTDSDATFTTNSAHPSLLWALEGLARAPEYFSLAMDALAYLVELDPGGKLGNRADATFISVISPPMPQTEASVEARLAVLDSLRERHPDIAWQITISTLPGFMWGGTYNHRPRFRSWGPAESKNISMAEYQTMIEGITDDLTVMVDATPERWPELIGRLPEIPAAKRQEIYLRLEEAAGG
jgi:hypothetical protein